MTMTSRLPITTLLVLVAVFRSGSAQRVLGGGTRAVARGPSVIARRRAADTVDPCYGIKCPDVSTCVAIGQGPTCVCPSQYQRIFNGVCTNVTTAYPDYIDAHNAARAAVGSVSIIWSDTVAASALDWANYLATKQSCNLIHGPPGNPYGQNLAWASGYASFSNAQAVNMWVAEGTDYTTSSYNHYTQVVWNTSLQVGCARVNCSTPMTYLWCCNYYPYGNIFGLLPYVRDPCFRYACPDVSACVSTSGAAVCTCPPGLTLVNNAKCLKDPCPAVKCPGNQVCSAPTGRPVCTCPKGTSLYPLNGTQCIPIPCVGVVCPATATCRANSDGAPICYCPPSQTLSSTTNSCTPSPDPTIETSIAVYSGAGFTGTVSVYRLPATSKCLKMPATWNGKVPSFKLVWNVGDTSLPTNTKTTAYNICYFWNGVGCSGTGWSQSCGAGSTSATCLAPNGQAGYGITCKTT